MANVLIVASYILGIVFAVQLTSRSNGSPFALIGLALLFLGLLFGHWKVCKAMDIASSSEGEFNSNDEVREAPQETVVQTGSGVSDIERPEAFSAQ